MASFVKRDFAILSSQFDMQSRFYSGALRGIPDRIAIYLGTRNSDFTFSWFAYLQAYWAVRFSKRYGKKSVVVLGGFDVCEEEDPHLADRLPSIRFLMANADCLLAVSERVKHKALKILPEARVSVIYHGFDSNAYAIGAKEPIVTTIGYVRQGNLERKGLKVFVKVAGVLPELKFVLVGEWLDDSIQSLKSIAPSNVTFTGFLPNPALSDLLARTSVYVQASTHEGFGCSLAEAMLSGCTPVVSNRGAIPEVVGDTGFYVDPTDERSVARGIQDAMSHPEQGAAARRRISNLFPLERRRELLLKAVEEVLE